ncbi:MAG: hypothetical protein H6670_14820 [Anaerolineaceae bacterium]|nr:hypothetical protein [Anaerolineaceae bacterium]
MKNKIRDFVYLDIERTRSILAQLSEGLPNERNSQTGREVGGSGDLEANVPFLVHATAGADYRYVRSVSETKSLHDHIFERCLTELDKVDLVTRLTEGDSFDWDESSFYDGMFILVTGIFKIVDYKYVVRQMANLPSIVRLIAKISLKAGQESTSKEYKKKETEFKNLGLKEIQQVIEEFYSDLTRVRIFPYRDDPQCVFLGDLDKEYYRYPSTTLSAMYGSFIDAGWKALIQVHKSNDVAFTRFTSIGGDASRLEDQVEKIADSLTDITNITQSVTFPSVAFTPLAIFREL